MSQQPCPSPACAQAEGAIARIIEPRTRDLGGFSVRRVLPAPGQRAVGPFVFFDEMGPATFDPGHGIDVRPHPHIGLATLTYLFEGEIMHRDSLGVVQPIRPGAVNWMTAGRGIVHSERTGDEERARTSRLHGIQSWIALPREQEEVEPAFFHHGAGSLPVLERDGATLRLIVGEAFGERSPVAALSPMFYLAAELTEGARLPLPADLGERAVYVVSGSVTVAGIGYESGRMLIAADGVDVEITAAADSRLMLLGGAPLDGPRHLWWNLLSTRPERIEQARQDWKEGRFDPVPGETEFIPLPED
ncbi:MAG: pirin family protein [Gammaproteobacteria bacterium]|jgi:redox-sensitive bicupin YhaK (pirin superfamily)